MEENKASGPKKFVFESPMITVIDLTETDIITASGFDDPERQDEGERIRTR